MAAELGVQGFLLLVHSIVPVLFAPFPDCLQPSTKPLGNGLHVHCEPPLSAAGAYVHKAPVNGNQLGPSGFGEHAVSLKTIVT
jgi:hypothetical protein